MVTLFFLRFYPTSVGGYVFTGLTIITLVTVVTLLTGFDQWIKVQAGLATPQPVPTAQASPTLALAPSLGITPSPSSVLEPATAFISISTETPSQTPKPTLEVTLPPTNTSTSTVTAEPTPIIALIKASEGGGAFIREKPGGKVLATLGNGATVTIIPNDLQSVNNITWVHVFAIVNEIRVEGWMIQGVLVTATPIADWQPSPTSPATSTP